MSVFAYGRTISPTLIDSDLDYHPIRMEDITATTGDFTYVATVGGLQVARAGLYQVSAQVNWYGGTRLDRAIGWHAIRVRVWGPLLDGAVADDRVAQINSVNTAVVQSGFGFQRLNTGSRLWIEAAHYSLGSSNVGASLAVLLVFPAESNEWDDATEDLGPFNQP
jgi:hypothetical protein